MLVGLVLLPILSVGFGWFVLRFGPHSAYAHDRRADVWFEKKEYANAIAEYDEAIRLDPQRAGTTAAGASPGSRRRSMPERWPITTRPSASIAA